MTHAYKLRRNLFSAAVLAVFAGVNPASANEAAAPSAVAAIDIAGLWKVQSGNGVIHVTDCGDGSPCGALVWTNSPPGVTVLDDNNSDPALRTRPLIGSPVFWGFKRKGSGWRGGKIYDAEGGKTYKSKLKLQEDGTLKVKGCVGPICQSQVWTRAVKPSEIK